MSQANKENAKGRRLWTALLTLIMLSSTSGVAMAQEEPGLTYAETLVEPMKYYSDGLVLVQGIEALLPEEEGETHTVSYYLHEPLLDTWMHYYTEEREHGRLARGPLYNPIDPVGEYERVLIGWYADEDLAQGPVNLLQAPVTADLSLYARFGDEADVFEPEEFDFMITLSPSLGFAAEADIGEENLEANPAPDQAPALDMNPESIPVVIIAAIQGEDEELELPEGLLCTITAQVEGIPEDVRYDLQWQNDIAGVLTDIPGETLSSITFPATRENLSCMWRLAIIF